MRYAGCAALLTGLSLASGCFQQEAPRLAAPAPAPTSRQQAATVSPSAMPASKELAAALQDSPDPEDRRDAIYEIADAEGNEVESAALIGAALYDPEPGGAPVRGRGVDRPAQRVRRRLAVDCARRSGCASPQDGGRSAGEIGGPNSRFLLQQALGDVDPAVREAAQEMLAEPSGAGSRRQLTVSFSPIESSASFDRSGRARSAISLRAAMKSLPWFTASSAISSPSRR